MTLARSSLVLVLALTASCGSSSETTPAATDDGITDVRVAVPAADPAFIDFVSSELVVEPGQEKMWCDHFEYTGEDIAFSDQDALQGKFGHHAILLSAKEPKAPGTGEDCSEAADMTKYEAFSIPKELPPGYGVYLPKGKRFVLQMHYVNAGRKPIRVRDVVRLKKRPIAEVTKWTSVMATNSIAALAIPPKGKKTVTFDCTIPVDGELMLVGGHMHEAGVSFRTLHGKDAASLATIYEVPEWKAEYRDAPPVTLFTGEPLPVAKGDVLRTSCTWNNPNDKELKFPEEMCSTFGYIAGTKTPIECHDGVEVPE